MRTAPLLAAASLPLVAFVGMDYGAMHGAVLASVEKRIQCFALLVPTASFAGWDGILANALYDEEYFATKDRFVSRENAEQLVAAARGPKTIRWYEGDHEVPFRDGQADRRAWLRAQLGLAARP